MKQQKKKYIKPVKAVKESIERALWESKAVKIDTEKQFTLASGKLSPIYIDCRTIISFPNVMDLIADKAVEIIEKKIGNVDLIAGGETAGIPFAAWIAAKLGKGMIYVRKEKKGYGAGKQIEGKLNQGDRVLLVEDLITDGGSKLNFINGIKEAGGAINSCIVVFDREQGGAQKLSGLGVKLFGLTTLSRTLQFGLENKYITEKDYKIVKGYLSKS